MLSWSAGRLADHLGRGRLVRWSVGVRCLLLGLVSWLVAIDQVVGATAVATVAIVVCTPAYPALVASLARLPGGLRWTGALVTVEVTTWVVGPAVGGLLLSTGQRTLLLAAPPALCVLGFACFVRAALPAGMVERPDFFAPLRLMVAVPAARGAVVMAVTVNLAIGLLQTLAVTLSGSLWRGGAAGWQIYGYVMAARGVGTLVGGALMARNPRHARPWMFRNAVATSILLALLAIVTPWLVVVAITVVFGATALAVEGDAIRVLQQVAPEGSTGTVLGFTDSAIVMALAAGSLMAGLPDGRLLLIVGAAVTLIAAAMTRGRAPVGHPAPGSHRDSATAGRGHRLPDRTRPGHADVSPDRLRALGRETPTGDDHP